MPSLDLRLAAWCVLDDAGDPASLTPRGGRLDTVESRGTLVHEESSPPGGASVPLGALLVRLITAEDLAAPSSRHRLGACDEVVFSRSDANGGRTQDRTLSIAIDDRYVSGHHLRIFREGGRWIALDEGSTNGTFVEGRRLGRGERSLLADEALLEVGHTFFLFRDGADGAADTPRLTAPARRDGFEPSTLNPEWELELSRIERLARTGHELLVEGESGVGKEVLARALHGRSGRTGPLVGVNCGALAENLLDDELFGHVKGAFSGAQSDRQGLIRAAHQGTLLLDEVGEMPPALQVKLLRVLEDHRVRPIGTEAETTVDVRVIAATHRDLRKLVAEGTFRQDLLARLGLLSTRVPSVRDRREDLGILIRSVLRAASLPLEGIRFDLDALRLLLLHDWPLNVRELRQALLVAVDLARGDGSSPVVLLPHHLPPGVREGASRAPRLQEPDRALDPEEQAQRERVAALLRLHAGNVTAVARELGLPRTNLQRLMGRLGIGRTDGG